MNATPSQVHDSPIHPATRDPLLWACGLAFWALFILMLAMAVFGAEPSRPVVVTGAAAINRRGDVMSWDAEQATGRERRVMLHGDFFSIVPPARRDRAREMFAAAASDVDGVHLLDALDWHENGAAYSVRFQRAGNVYLATITRRQ